MGRHQRREGGRDKKKSVPHFPDEIFESILSGLPLNSLARFRCVSKQWRSLIANICTTKTGSPTVLLVSNSKAHTFMPHSIKKHIHVKSVYIPWRKMCDTYRNQFGILGSCNGLVLMHIDEDLFLWNPLTRFFKKVLAYGRLRDEGYGICSGLCYDSSSNEYKAVLALAHQTPDYGGEFVVVGSFRSKSWTDIEFPYMSSSVNSGPIVNGNLHWFASKNDSGSHFLSPHQIIYFNAHMDKFEEVPMPEPRGEDGDIACGLGVLDGCLCMSRLVRPGNSESNVEVLLMKEYKVKNSWTILFVVPDCFTFDVHDTLVPLGYTKNGEVLTEVYRDIGWHIRAFNLTKNSYRRLSIPKDLNLHVIEHEESLITPTDYGWEEEELKGEATYLEDSCLMTKGKDGRWTMEDSEESERDSDHSPYSEEFESDS